MIFLRSFSARPALVAITVLLSQTLAPLAAHAQDDSSAAETAAARALAIEGLKLAQSGNCNEAVDKLERSEKLRHSPIVLGRLGECLVNLGKLVEGTESLRRMLREPLPPDPSVALQQAYERAQAALDAAKPRIAGLTINVKAPPEAKVSVTVDGEPVPPAAVGIEIPADPGDHAIEATAPGFLKATVRAKVAAGEKQAVSLELERDPNAPLPTAGDGAEPAASEDPAAPPPSGASAGDGMSFPNDAVPEREPNRTPAFLAYGVGAVGLGVGIGFGLAAMGAKSDLDSACTNDVCPPDEQDRLDSAKTKGTISTIGFAVGGVGLALGTILLVASSSSEEGSASAPVRRYRAMIGPGSIKAAIDF